MITKRGKLLEYLINMHFLIQIATSAIINLEASAVSSNNLKQGQNDVSSSSKLPNIASILQKNDEKSLESVELYTKKSLPKVLNANNEFQQNLIRTSELSPVIETDKIDWVNNSDSMPVLDIPRGIINAYEAFSNFLNWLIEKPKDIGRYVSKAITHNLDNVGHKLIGL